MDPETPFLHRFRLPLTVALPAVVSLAMFVVAVGSTQIAVETLRRSTERGLHTQAHIFLDAVAGGIAATLPQGRIEIERQIVSALAFQSALLEEAIAVRWTDEAGEQHTTFIGERGEEVLLNLLDRAFEQTAGPTYPIYDEQAQTLQVARTYAGAHGPFAVSTLFDARAIAETQRVASMAAIVIDIAVAFLAAFATFFLTRAMLKPLERFIYRLAAENHETSIPRLRRGPELDRLEHALALREQSEAERALTASHLAQQERDSLLAKLAASIAHEVRNPLAGLKNGVSTLKRYGDDEAVRQQTVTLLDHGLAAIERVVDVTLSTYRRRSGARILRGQDICDLELLVGSEARRAGVLLHWDVDPHATITTDADALRQILINLLLNAIRATPAKGTVTVSLQAPRTGGDAAAVTVADTGRGMPADVVASLVTGEVDALPQERGLGIWMVANLVDRIGARLSVSSQEGSGTAVTIIIPASEATETNRYEQNQTSAG